MGQTHPVARAPLTVHKRMDISGPTIEDVDLESVDSIREFSKAEVNKSHLRSARVAVLRDAVRTCYTQYGPNNAVKCRPIYIEYMRHVEENGVIRFNIPELHPELAKDQTESETTQQTEITV